MRVKKRSKAKTNVQQSSTLIVQPTYKKVNVRADGNCLFRAISLGLYGTEDYHVHVRTAAFEYIMEHWDRFKDAIKIEYFRWNVKTREQYQAYMSKYLPGSAAYGGDPELSAVALAYEIQIAVHIDPMNDPIAVAGSGQLTVHLLYKQHRYNGIDSGHYDLLEYMQRHIVTNPQLPITANARISTHKRKNDTEPVYSKRLKTMDQDSKLIEKQRLAKQKQIKRNSDIQYRENERRKNASRLQLKRNIDKHYREAEKQKHNASLKLKRSNTQYREVEKQKDAIARKLKRSN